MELPFTVEAFYGVFRDYNEAVWPVQILLNAGALAALVLVVRRRRWSDVGVVLILAFLWAWLAFAYHLAFFTRINPLAYVFSGVSLTAALVLLWEGVVCGKLRFVWTPGGRATIGCMLIVFALVVYPVWSWYAGHPYPTMPTFGLPCPTTIFTIGMLAFLARPYPRSVLVVPVLWCFMGGQAAVLLDVPQDYALFVAGVIGLSWLVRS